LQLSLETLEFRVVWVYLQAGLDGFQLGTLERAEVLGGGAYLELEFLDFGLEGCSVCHGGCMGEKLKVKSESKLDGGGGCGWAGGLWLVLHVMWQLCLRKQAERHQATRHQATRQAEVTSPDRG
jgi:hypothetical protein